MKALLPFDRDLVDDLQAYWLAWLRTQHQNTALTRHPRLEMWWTIDTRLRNQEWIFRRIRIDLWLPSCYPNRCIAVSSLRIFNRKPSRDQEVVRPIEQPCRYAEVLSNREPLERAMRRRYIGSGLLPKSGECRLLIPQGVGRTHRSNALLDTDAHYLGNQASSHAPLNDQSWPLYSEK